MARTSTRSTTCSTIGPSRASAFAPPCPTSPLLRTATPSIPGSTSIRAASSSSRAAPGRCAVQGASRWSDSGGSAEVVEMPDVVDPPNDSDLRAQVEYLDRSGGDVEAVDQIERHAQPVSEQRL